MPRTDHQNTTSAAALDVTHATHGHELVAVAADQVPVWRHPAEAALVEIAGELGGDIEIMASAGGDLDVTIPGRYRIEVRSIGVCIVALSVPRGEDDVLGKAWLCPDGTDAMIRLLTAIQEAPSEPGGLLLAA